MHYYCIEYDLFIDNILNENSHFLFFKTHVIVEKFEDNLEEILTKIKNHNRNYNITEIVIKKFKKITKKEFELSEMK